MVIVSHLLGDLCVKKRPLDKSMKNMSVGCVLWRRECRGPTIVQLQQEVSSFLWVKNLQISVSSVSLTASRALGHS